MMNDYVSLFELTPRERQVADLLLAGHSNPQIAKELNISRWTVKSHVSNILSKLGLTSRHEIRNAAHEHTLPARDHAFPAHDRWVK